MWRPEGVVGLFQPGESVAVRRPVPYREGSIIRVQPGEAGTVRAAGSRSSIVCFGGLDVVVPNEHLERFGPGDDLLELLPDG